MKPLKIGLTFVGTLIIFFAFQNCNSRVTTSSNAAVAPPSVTPFANLDATALDYKIAYGPNPDRTSQTYSIYFQAKMITVRKDYRCLTTSCPVADGIVKPITDDQISEIKFLLKQVHSVTCPTVAPMPGGGGGSSFSVYTTSSTSPGAIVQIQQCANPSNFDTTQPLVDYITHLM